MLGTKLLYGIHSTKNFAYNVQQCTRFSAYSIFRIREIGDSESKLDFLGVTATERILNGSVEARFTDA